MTCYFCDEELVGPLVANEVPDPQPQDRVYLGGTDGVHRACMLREVLGGIGHLTDHNLWCNERQDCDAGLSRYASAVAVWDWVQNHSHTY